MDDVKIGSNRSFGIVFFIVFLLIAIYPLINQWRDKDMVINYIINFFILGLLILKF